MRILIVHNNEINLKILKLMLSKDNYEIKSVSIGEQALDKMSGSVDLVISDIDLPDMSGYELCQCIKGIDEYKNIPVILISPSTNTDEILKGFAYGANDYIKLPFTAEGVRVRVAAQLKFKEIMRTSGVNEQMETIFSLKKLAQSKDDSSPKHLERIRMYCLELAKALKLDKDYIKMLEFASPLHDIGKVAMSDLILLKSDKLTSSEFEEMKKHTFIGYNTLKEVRDKIGSNPFLEMAMEIAYFHHERFDGSGYPKGLKDKEIPLSARIVAIADSYDGLRSSRCYKESFSHEKSMEIIKGNRDKLFDSKIVNVLKTVADKFDNIWKENQDE